MRQGIARDCNKVYQKNNRSSTGMTDGKITKTEWILLALTGVFLCGLLILSFLDREQVGRMGISTEIDVPQEEILPDLSPLDLNAATGEELQKLPNKERSCIYAVVETMIQQYTMQ